jgi:hypothetical protein
VRAPPRGGFGRPAAVALVMDSQWAFTRRDLELPWNRDMYQVTIGATIDGINHRHRRHPKVGEALPVQIHHRP